MKQIFALVLISFSLSALAHGDDDHGAAALVVSQSVAPRASAATEEFEVVALLDGGGKKLLVYVDRFASNEPVQKAVVEIEGAGVKGVATESSPGLYAINLPAVPSGRQALTISIEAGELSDLLSLSLDSTPPVGNSVHLHGWSEKLIWLMAGLLAAAGLALLVARRRKQVKN